MSKSLVKEGYIRVSRGRVWYRVSAGISGSPLVALHGGTVAASGYFAPLLALAAERPVILYDHIDTSHLYDLESAGAEARRPNDARLAAFMADMAEIQAGLPLPSGSDRHRMYLMGHSWGTLLARPMDMCGLILDLVEPPQCCVQSEDAPARRPSVTNRLLQLKMSGHLHKVDLPALFITNDQDARHAGVRNWFRGLLPGCDFLTLPRSAVSRPGEDPRFLEAARGFLRRAESGRGLSQFAPELARAA
jgi:hypothetical protein